MRPDPIWRSSGARPGAESPAERTDPLLPVITDKMIAPPRTSPDLALDDDTVASLIAELDGDTLPVGPPADAVQLEADAVQPAPDAVQPAARGAELAPRIVECAAEQAARIVECVPQPATARHEARSAVALTRPSPTRASRSAPAASRPLAGGRLDGRMVSIVFAVVFAAIFLLILAQAVVSVLSAAT